MATLPMRSSRHANPGAILLKDAIGLAQRIDQVLRQKHADHDQADARQDRSARASAGLDESSYREVDTTAARATVPHEPARDVRAE
jgi:hypothetical protein